MLLADIVAERCEETAALVERAGGRASSIVTDVADASAVGALADAAAARLGTIDLVVNNAGVAAGGSFAASALEDWRWIIDINLWGVIHGCHAFVPHLIRGGGGAMLNVASLAGIACAPGMASYNVTKAGVIALSETLAAELREHGIRVTVLCPAFFRTNLQETMRVADPQFRALADALFARATMTADAVAAAALRAVDRGALYCLPMREGRVVWRLKRLMPARFVRVVANRRLQRMAAAHAAPTPET
jgi:short-subunit dehydrogenase